MKYDTETSAVPEPSRRWSEQDGVISFTVTSNGLTGEEWITHFKAKGLQVGPYAKRILLSKDFQPTTGIMTEIRVLKPGIFKDDVRVTREIRAEATHREFVKPNAEVGCLIRDMFTNAEIEAMGLWGIVAMHDPIEISDGNPILLAARRSFDYSLCSDDGRPVNQWYGSDGFAFAVPRVA